jgi:hypothetical protein
VVHQQQEVRVAAGSAWTTRRGLVALAALAALGPNGDRAIANAAPDQGVEIDMGAPPDVLHDHVARVPSSGERGHPNGRGRADHALGQEHGVHPRTLDRADDPQLDLKTQIRRQAVTPALDVGVADAAAAIARYRELITTQREDAASYALYSTAYVQHMKLGHDSEALATLEAYRRRFTRGKEYAAALWLRVRVRCLHAIDSRCREAAYTYLHEVNEGPSAQVAERITQTR